MKDLQPAGIGMDEGYFGIGEDWGLYLRPTNEGIYHDTENLVSNGFTGG